MPLNLTPVMQPQVIQRRMPQGLSSLSQDNYQPAPKEKRVDPELQKIGIAMKLFSEARGKGSDFNSALKLAKRVYPDLDLEEDTETGELKILDRDLGKQLSFKLKDQRLIPILAGEIGKKIAEGTGFTAEDVDDYKKFGVVGVNVEDLEKKDDLKTFEEKERIKAKYKDKGEGTWSASKPGLDENGKQVFFQTNSKTGESRIVGGVSPEPKKGMRIQTTDGTVIEVGGQADMTAKTKGDLEKKVIDGSEQFNRMQTIANEFKPEYQEIGSRLGAAWTDIQSKLGRDVDSKDASFLTDFKGYQRKSIENINLYIKEMTGAQMSEKEASRLRLAQPDPGEKWYKGDSPITFKSKMDDVLKYSRAAVARYKYYLSKGFTDSQIKQMINTNEARSLDEIAKALGE